MLQEKEVKDISVQDIVNHCGASRSVFYKYFKDKYDIINWVTFEDFHSALLGQMEQNKGPVGQYTLSALEYIYKNKSLYAKIAKYKGQNSLQDHFLPLYVDSTTRYMKYVLKTDTLSKDTLFAITFAGAAHSHMVQEWIEDGFITPPKELANLLVENLPPAFAIIKTHLE